MWKMIKFDFSKNERTQSHTLSVECSREATDGPLVVALMFSLLIVRKDLPSFIFFPLSSFLKNFFLLTKKKNGQGESSQQTIGLILNFFLFLKNKSPFLSFFLSFFFLSSNAQQNQKVRLTCVYTPFRVAAAAVLVAGRSVRKFYDFQHDDC